MLEAERCSEHLSRTGKFHQAQVRPDHMDPRHLNLRERIARVSVSRASERCATGSDALQCQAKVAARVSIAPCARKPLAAPTAHNQNSMPTGARSSSSLDSCRFARPEFLPSPPSCGLCRV